jgi:hypothetical protein
MAARILQEDMLILVCNFSACIGRAKRLYLWRNSKLQINSAETVYEVGYATSEAICNMSAPRADADGLT